MARPQRNNVDYFPFYCEEGTKMFYLEETYGNDGFAVFLKLLRELAKKDYHYLDLSKNTTLMFLSAKCKVSKEILISIINDLVELEKFNSMLWKENNIIWCQDFIDSIQDAYLKRSNECMTFDGLLLLLISLGVRKPIKCKSKGDVKPQSKEEDSIEDEIIINDNKKEILNSHQWLEQICMKKNISTEKCNKFLNEFITDLELKNEMDKPIEDIKKHFVNWLNIKLKVPKKFVKSEDVGKVITETKKDYGYEEN